MSVCSQKKTTSRKTLGLIFFIMLMDVIGISILSPVAPYIVRQYSASASTVTLLSVIYALAQFLAAPVLGKISDRVGRRPVLLACVLGSAIGYFIFGFGGSLWVLFLSRLIDGISGGNLSTAAAYIVDVSSPENRTKNMSLIGMSYGFGFILGPVLGGALGQISLRAPLFAAGFLSLVSVVMIYFILPESLPLERRETAALQARDFNPIATIGSMLSKPGLLSLLGADALFDFVFDGSNSVLGVYLISKFSAQTYQTGLMYFVAGVGMALVQGLLIGKLAPRYGEKRLAVIGLSGFAIGGVLYTLVPVFGWLYPLTFIQFALTGFIFPTLGTMASRQVNQSEQGMLAGVRAAMGGLTAALGPLWAGLSYDHIAPVAPFWVGAVIVLAAGVILARFRMAGSQVKMQRAATVSE
jgi:multidrug resistance protein